MWFAWLKCNAETVDIINFIELMHYVQAYWRAPPTLQPLHAHFLLSDRFALFEIKATTPGHAWITLKLQVTTLQLPPLLILLPGVFGSSSRALSFLQSDLAPKQIASWIHTSFASLTTWSNNYMCGDFKPFTWTSV